MTYEHTAFMLDSLLGLYRGYLGHDVTGQEGVPESTSCPWVDCFCAFHFWGHGSHLVLSTDIRTALEGCFGGRVGRPGCTWLGRKVGTSGRSQVLKQIGVTQEQV